ncbi:hypothetical protein B0J14DRAFT_674497 [Halenospora varia]|nr:hypothetical protein B0J14DRAFT_674497 [Halenospora varia]
MSRNWGDLGLLFLHDLEALLLINDTGDPLFNCCTVQNELAEIEIKFVESQLKTENVEQTESKSLAYFNVTAAYETQSHLLTALSWLCAAVRHSPPSEVALSSTRIAAVPKPEDDGHIITICLSELELLPLTQSCWYPIFRHCVIADGFPIRDRINGEGLKPSFQDMFLMSRSLMFVEFDGGFVVDGLLSVLISIRELQDDDALQ